MFSRSRYMSESSQVYGFIETVEERGKKEEARKGEISWRERFEEESNNVLAFCLSSRFYNFLLHNVKGLTCMWWCYWLLIPAIGREICVIISAPSRARYPSLLCDNNGNKTIAKKNIVKNQEESEAKWGKRREQGDLFIVKIIINIRTQKNEARGENQWHNIIVEDEGCGLAKMENNPKKSASAPARSKGRKINHRKRLESRETFGFLPKRTFK